MADKRVNLVPSDGLEFTFDPPGMRVRHQPEGTLLGRADGDGDGAVETVVLGSGLSLAGNVLSSSGGGGGATATVVEVDLGPTPVYSGRFTVTDAGISPSSKVLVWQAPGPYTGKGSYADEAEMDPVVASAFPGSGSMTVVWSLVSPPSLSVNRANGNPVRSSLSLAAHFDALVGRAEARIVDRVVGNVKFAYMVMG